MTDQRHLHAGPISPPDARPGDLRDAYRSIRAASETLGEPLELEDYVVQSMPDASPVKWHLAHSAWFFETFVLAPHAPGYRPLEPAYAYLFNSYYNTVGPQHDRPRRGVLSRPTVAEVMAYRAHVDGAVEKLLDAEPSPELLRVIETGLHHEQQHQELILTDLKHALAVNPLRPAYCELDPPPAVATPPLRWKACEEDLHWIGHEGDRFAFDNERPRHRQFVEGFELATRPVTCGEYLEFIEEGGYRQPELWLSDGWITLQSEGWQAPLYWEERDGAWWLMTLGGMRPVEPAEPVAHVSYFEADAYARWAGVRLPSEAAWENAAADLPIEGNFAESVRFHPMAAAPGHSPDAGTNGNGAVGSGTNGNGATGETSDLLRQMFGDVWEWTASPYTAYPGYRPPAGPLGEYNGKFMSGQMVLRGGSCATPRSHIRATYRNFFPPTARWQFTGIRLAKDLA